jgi:hypothetical protein
MPLRLDAAVTVAAQNAPTATWKTAQNAVSHSAHTPHRLLSLERRRRTKGHEVNLAAHTKFLTLPPIHRAQVLSYLKASRLRLGLLINFNADWLRGNIRRIIL